MISFFQYITELNQSDSETPMRPLTRVTVKPTIMSDTPEGKAKRKKRRMLGDISAAKAGAGKGLTGKIGNKLPDNQLAAYGRLT